MICVWLLSPTWWEEETDSQKLPHDIHTEYSKGWGRRITPNVKSCWAIQQDFDSKKIKMEFPAVETSPLQVESYGLGRALRWHCQLWADTWSNCDAGEGGGTGLLKVIRWPLRSTTSAWGRRGDQRRHQHLALSLAMWGPVLTWCLSDLSLEPWTWAVSQNKPLFLLNYPASGSSLY